ncbi:formimidoylglutamate deiminase [Pseudacidovorax intermedius]|uniref:Formimidoylglutamate deiminase n=1 Tax=Pseudacidovorax intermedius TaxID=433924 RepID=A0A370FS02_9BURK|nr:formimidoylglutamate deiminase [Pseudacidovorax intermedius]RDI29119.1 formimidoylglutamate deiminase [Pseudacidovorax intermedius]
MSAGSLFADHALLPGGWARDVRLDWDANGCFTAVQVGAAAEPGVPRAEGPLLPGMPNLHSHAFQRGMAGLTEYRAEAQDSFWSWRSLMYRFALRLSPAQLEAIAFGLYVDMLEAGYTAVCEFHYVHHDTDGHPYADDAELARALLRAAARAGIGLTLLPVLYQTSGFGGAAPAEGQRRFIRSTESMLRLLDALRPACNAQGARLGLAPHSLRAVPPEALRDALAGLAAQDATAPIHIHIAEQTKEVEDCVAWSGQRPVAWLLDHAPVDARWCLVHATHMDADEYRRAATTGAVAGLCPTTEANLGDGLFDLPRWTEVNGELGSQAGHGVSPGDAAPALRKPSGGAWGIGSDSHACVDAAEELLMLEYGQRLIRRQRNVAATEAQPEVATAMWLAAVAGGAQAAGRALGGLAVDQQADLVVLDAAHPVLAGLDGPQMLSAHVFAAGRQRPLAQAYVAGRKTVDAGCHPLRAEAQRAFVQARRELLAGGA